MTGNDIYKYKYRCRDIDGHVVRYNDLIVIGNPDRCHTSERALILHNIMTNREHESDDVALMIRQDTSIEYNYSSDNIYPYNNDGMHMCGGIT